MTERTSAGDPARTLELLWRNEPGQSSIRKPRGRPRVLDVETVIAQAIDLADREGLEMLSIRALARSLSVGAMTLYSYVPGREELLDLMLDSIFSEVKYEWLRGCDWLDRLRMVAYKNLELARSHPWSVSVWTARPPLGPGQLRKYESELEAFQGSGLSDLQMDDSLNHLLGFVRSIAKDESDHSNTLRSDGLTDMEWWDKVQPRFAKLVDESQYPLATRVGQTAGSLRASAYDPYHGFHFGLSVVIEGIRQLAPANDA